MQPRGRAPLYAAGGTTRGRIHPALHAYSFPAIPRQRYAVQDADPGQLLRCGRASEVPAVPYAPTGELGLVNPERHYLCKIIPI